MFTTSINIRLYFFTSIYLLLIITTYYVDIDRKSGP